MKIAIDDRGKQRVTMSRKQAKQVGDYLYFTGKTCTNGHRMPRYTSSGICTECNRNHTNKYRRANPDVVAAINKRSRERREK